MKYLSILVLLLIATLQSSAQTWPSNYTRLNSNYYWRMGAFDALNLPTRDTSLLTGQWVKAGSIIFDSTQAAGSRVWVYNGAYWERLGAGGEGFVSIGAENGLTAVNDSTLRLGGTLLDTTDIAIPQATRLRLLANGANGYMADNQKPPWLVFKTSDTISNNTYADAGSASYFGRDVYFSTNRRDYYRGFEFRNNLMTSDSTRLYSVGGDFGYSMKSARVFTRADNDDTRSVWNNTTGSSIDWEAVPNFIAWDYHRRPIGATASQRSRGGYAGVSAYLIMGNNYADTVDMWIGHTSMSRLNSNNRVLKYIDYWAGGGSYSDSRVDSTWSFFSRYTQPRFYHNGPVAFGGNNSGPTEQFELFGNFKHFNLRSSNAADDSMVVWNETDKMYGKRPISSGSSTNLGNTDLTQTDATRNYDIDDQNLYWLNTGTWRIYGSGTYSGRRLLELDGPNSIGYLGPIAGTKAWGFDADSLKVFGIGLRNDSTNNKILVYNPNTNTVSYSNWIGGGGGSVSFGTDNQVPYTNSAGTGFDYSANFTFDGSQLLMLAGSAASPTYSFSGDPNTGIYSSSGDVIGFATNGVRRIFFSNVGIGADNAQGPQLNAAASTGTAPGLIPNRTNSTTGIGSSSANVISLITSASSKADIGTSFIVNPGNLDFDFTVYGDTQNDVLFVGASTNRVGVLTNTPGFQLDVNGMINTPGTEASTYRWAATATEVPATTTYAAPTNYIGSSTNYALFTPDAWLRVNVAGTLYGIPAYIISTP